MKRINEILRRFKERYGSPETALVYANPLELLIATILSAQCTDVRVNAITPALFAAYPTAQDYVEADVRDIERLIESCGLYRNKAKFIQSACQDIVENFGGEVPRTREGLESLAGVGRKTANVVLANVFKEPAIAVDTHVFRVARRLGFSDADDVLGVEEDLMQTIPRDDWIDAHHWLIYHGREICKARNPLCDRCYLRDLCPEVAEK